MNRLIAILCLTAACATVAPPKLDTRVLDLQVAPKAEPVEPHVGVYRASFTYPKVHHHLLGSGIQLTGPDANTTGPIIGFQYLQQGGSNTNTFAGPISITYSAGASLLAAAGIRSSGAGSLTNVHLGLNGDDNSGIWFSANDTIELVTSGTSRMQVTSTGQAIFTMPGNMTFTTPTATFSAAATVTGTFQAGNNNFNVNGASGAITLTGATSLGANTQIKAASMMIQNTAPTISSGFGTSPSVATNNGTAAFTINVGTGGVATSGVIGLPTATNGWVCSCDDLTQASTSVNKVIMTATSTTTCTVTNKNMSTGAAAAWAASDILHCMAMGR